MKRKDLLYIVKQIACVESDNQYSWVHLKDGRKFQTAYPMSFWQRDLQERKHNFMRIHKFWLVNMDLVSAKTIEKEVDRRAYKGCPNWSQEVIYVNVGKLRLPVSHLRKPEFLNRIQDAHHKPTLK